MRKFIYLCLAMLLSCCADAQSAGTGVSITTNWIAPVARENGVALLPSEIGGYEIRYRLKGDGAFNTLVIPNSSAKQFTLAGLPGGDYDVQIAAYDTDGLYSNFVAIAYRLNTSPPKAVSGFTLKRAGVNVLEICLGSANCKVVKGDGQ